MCNFYFPKGKNWKPHVAGCELGSWGASHSETNLEKKGFQSLFSVLSGLKIPTGVLKKKKKKNSHGQPHWRAVVSPENFF